MKPSVTIDERGVVLHVTNDAGDGIAIPLSSETIGDIVAAAARAHARLLTEGGRKKVIKSLLDAVLELTNP